MPPLVGATQAKAEGPSVVDIYWDATYSMQGYATIANGNLYRTLPDELADLGNSMGEVHFFRFGEEIKPLEGREHRNFSDPAYYDEVITAVHNVVEKADPKHVSVVVTDLFESDSDWSNVTQKLKDKYFSKHLTVAVIGIRNPFRGDVFDVGLSASKFFYDSGSDPKKYRPFYLFIMGPDEKVVEIIERWQERQTTSREMNYIVCSENLMEHGADLSVTEVEASENLFGNETLELTDKKMREFGISKFDKAATLTVRVPDKARLGALPLNVERLLKKKAEVKVFRLEEDGWQPVEKRDSDVQLKVEEDAANPGTYVAKLSFTPERTLEHERVNFVYATLLPDDRCFRTPDWVRAWNMPNIDVSPEAFDGSKTVNLLRIVESLRAMMIANAKPALLEMHLVINAQ